MIIRRKKTFKQWLLAPFSHTSEGHQPDFILLGAVGLLLFLGLLFLSSASSSLAFYQHGQNTYFFVKQQFFNGVIPGLILFYFALRFNYQKYEKYYVWFLIAAIILLIIVFIPGLQMSDGKANSWIKLGTLCISQSVR